MKNILLALFIICLTSTQAISIELLEKGTYTCNYELNNKNETCIIHSDGKGTSFFEGNCRAVRNEAKFVKENNCQYDRSATKVYRCYYSDATCFVTLFKNGMNTTSCESKNNFQYKNKFKNTSQVIEQAKNEKCRPEL